MGGLSTGTFKMINYKKANWIQLLCAIVIIITTIYLIPRLHGIEKLAWGLWGLGLIIGSLVESYKDIAEDKNKRKKIQ